MLLATIVLAAIPQTATLAKSVADSADPAVSVSEPRSTPARELPSMPTPKLNVSSSAVEPPVAPVPMIKVNKPRIRETRGQRVAWYSLAVVGHGAAAFDAYSTRLAVSGHYGTEGNPFLRPFSHSNSLYAATQVSPLVMDYLGKRMMTSNDRWLRRLWWVPQTLGAGFSVGAGVHNLGVVH
jgi:hypothetical protein